MVQGKHFRLVVIVLISFLAETEQWREDLNLVTAQLIGTSLTILLENCTYGTNVYIQLAIWTEVHLAFLAGFAQIAL